ncbi:hypothetical protein KAJ99_09780 [Latilactobacillus sakei]|uniref:hypothetical protein n=1 Tax=Latilactobacillus sakei TaxID=1599 RepID=UPI001F1940E3|nr:hypothetical protein [Latilactobacillus sakei]MCE8502531.1 hypothetical protein [Latilactobacillus sakei]
MFAVKGDFGAVKGDFAVKGDLQISSIMKDKNCDFFCLFIKKYNATEKKEKESNFSCDCGGPVQIDGRESCMDSAIVLQTRTSMLDSWLGSNLRFLEDKDQR